MRTYRILLSGPTIHCDQQLICGLQEFAAISTLSVNAHIFELLSEQVYDLILFEVTANSASDVEVIRQICSRFPTPAIVLIDGNAACDVLATAISYGVKDAFKKPYKWHLVVERVSALLQLTQSQSPK